MVRGLATIKGYYDYGSSKQSKSQPSWQCAIRKPIRIAIKDLSGATRRPVEGFASHRLGSHTPRAGMFVWAKVPEPWASSMSTMDFAFLTRKSDDGR